MSPGSGYPNHRSGVEDLEIQRRQVELCRRFRIGGEQNLEASIEPEAIHDVGTNPTPDAVSNFEDHWL